MKLKFILIIAMTLTICGSAYAHRDVVLTHSNSNSGFNQIYIEHPRVTFDEELCELSVYFGSTSTIDLECVDATGTPYYYVYGEYHVACETTTYSNLPSGYYTITIHSVYGITYTGNFTVN